MVFQTLSPANSADDRDFTRLAHHADDLRTLAAMAERVFGVLASPPWPRQERVVLSDPNGLEFTLLINRPEVIASGDRFTVVGFFGQRSPAVTQRQRQALWDIDERLVEEVKNYPGVLGLACWEREDGNYANLVLLADRAAADHWRQSPIHQRAVKEHAPVYYQSIRIHNGTLERASITLQTTKYYDFRPAIPWFAQRELQPVLTRALEVPRHG